MCLAKTFDLSINSPQLYINTAYPHLYKNVQKDAEVFSVELVSYKNIITILKIDDPITKYFYYYIFIFIYFIITFRAGHLNLDIIPRGHACMPFLSLRFYSIFASPFHF